MLTCPCGSNTVHVTYQTPTTLTLADGQPTTVQYQSANPVFTVASCVGCGAMLDIDESVTGGEAEGAKVALTAARTIAQAWLSKLPLVTLRARLLPEQAVKPAISAVTKPTL